MAILKNLQQENEALRAKLAAMESTSALPIKVSAKGGVSVYGLGRWPVTLYESQWTSLLSQKESILAFIESNRHRLATKAGADDVD